MKGIIRSVLCLFLMSFGLLIITGCGQNLSIYAGTYHGEYIKIVGDDDSNKNVDEEFFLELDANGMGKHHRDGEVYDVVWSLDGEKFTMTEKFISEIKYTGTLKDGKLDIFNGDPTDIWTYEYVYTKK